MDIAPISGQSDDYGYKGYTWQFVSLNILVASLKSRFF